MSPTTPCAPREAASSSMREYAVPNPLLQADSIQGCSKFCPQARCSTETYPCGHCQVSEYELPSGAYGTPKVPYGEPTPYHCHCMTQKPWT